MDRLRRTSPARAGERGFTLAEVLVAAGLLVFVALTALAACRLAAGALRAGGSAGNDPLVEQSAIWRADAASAFAVFVPQRTLDGARNDGREIDFYASSDRGQPLLWCYRYDPAARTLQRWDYAPDGTRGVRDAVSGTIDTAASYPPLRGIERFAATALAGDTLVAGEQNVYAGLGALFARAPRAYPVRFAVPGVPDAVGGNGVVQVSLADERGATTIVHLAAGSMPTGFTVTGTLLWHAIVYRVDQTHRFAFGLAGKSHVFINARVDVSYDGWTTRKTWCDFNLLGAPNGLDPHDPHADYKPDEPLERADAIVATCRRLHPIPPARDAAGYPSDPYTTIPAPLQPGATP